MSICSLVLVCCVLCGADSSLPLWVLLLPSTSLLGCCCHLLQKVHHSNGGGEGETTAHPPMPNPNPNTTQPTHDTEPPTPTSTTPQHTTPRHSTTPPTHTPHTHRNDTNQTHTNPTRHLIVILLFPCCNNNHDDNFKQKIEHTKRSFYDFHMTEVTFICILLIEFLEREFTPFSEREGE